MRGKLWTDKEELYLKKNWSRMSIAAIGKFLGRSKASVKNKGKAMGLGNQIYGDGEMFSIRMLNDAFGKSTVSHMTVNRMRKTGLNVRCLRTGRTCRYSVRIDEFWEWLRLNQNYYPVSKLEPLALGPEPDWVAGARRSARDFPVLRNGKKWTEHDDMLLMSMARQERPIREICAALRRSENAVRTHAAKNWAIDIGYTADKRRRPWTEAEDRQVVELVKDGRCSMEIAHIMDRSERMVRVRLKELCGTYSIEKLLAMEEAEKRGKRKRDKAGSAGRVRTGKRKAG